MKKIIAYQVSFLAARHDTCQMKCSIRNIYKHLFFNEKNIYDRGVELHGNTLDRMQRFPKTFNPLLVFHVIKKIAEKKHISRENFSELF